MGLLFCVSKNDKIMVIVRSLRRNSNIELLRILCILSIIAHHYVVNSGLMDKMAENPTSFPTFFYYMFGMWGKTGINCFLLITGYYMCCSKIKLTKWLRYYFEIIFYNLCIGLVFVLLGKEQFSLLFLIKKLFFIRLVKDDFVSCFMWFYLFIPFLNMFVASMNKKTHMFFIILLLFMYCVVGSFPNSINMNYVEWFCVIYLIASFLRLYPPPASLRWGAMAIVSIVLSVVSVVILALFNIDIWFPYLFVCEPNKIMSVIVSVCLFMFFKDFHLPYNKYINLVASSVFGVLLIHANSNAMRQWLWQEIVRCADHYMAPNYILYSIGCVFLIFLSCVVIDQLRKATIEKWWIKFIEKRFSKTVSDT